MLASQFVAGLRPELKEKLAGVEGDMEQLLVNTKFKEAKRREMQLDRDRPRAGIFANTVQGGPPEAGKPLSEPPLRGSWKQDYSHMTCHHCGGKGHIAHLCPLKQRAEPREVSAKGLTATQIDALEEEMTTLKCLGVGAAGELTIGQSGDGCVCGWSHCQGHRFPSNYYVILLSISGVQTQES